MTTTRYYLTDTLPGIAVARHAAWTMQSASSPLRSLVSVRPTAGTLAAGGVAETSTTQQRGMVFQGIGAPDLPARVMSGSYALAFNMSETITGADAFLHAIGRVVSADGLTVRGTLFNVTETFEAGTSASVRTMSGVLTPVTAQAGDRLVVEVGAFLANTFSLSSGVNLGGGNYGSMADLVATDGSTAAGVPWVELILEDPPNPPTGLIQTAATLTTVTVDWTAPAAGAAPTGYEYRVDAGAPVNVGLATDALLPGLAPATTYSVQVRTLAATGSSAWSAALLVDTLDPIPPDRRYWTQRLASSLGLDPVEDQPVVEVRTYDHATDTWTLDADLSNGLTGYTITGGRRTPTARTEPLTATLGFATARLPATPAIATRLQVALSDAVAAALGLDPDDAVRFTGEVTDPTVDHEARRTSLVCVGRLARANRRSVDGTGWPIEDDGARITRILAAAGVQAGTVDAGLPLLAAPTRADVAGKLLDQVTASSLGQVVEQPTGDVDWHDAEHRRGTPVHMTLAAADVFKRVTWSQRLDALVNDLDVKTATGGVVTVTDPESAALDRYGPWPAAVDTILVGELAAYELGIDIVGRRADPSWQLPDLTVDLLRTIDLPDLADALTIRHASLLELTGLPVGCPVPQRVYVEGWTETATPRTWRLQANVSDPLLSGVGIRWIDFPDSDAYQWQDLDLDLSWFDVARTTDPANTL